MNNLDEMTVKEKIKLAGYTQTSLAEHLQLSRHTIVNWCAEGVAPHIDMLLNHLIDIKTGTATNATHHELRAINKRLSELESGLFATFNDVVDDGR